LGLTGLASSPRHEVIFDHFFTPRLRVQALCLIPSPERVSSQLWFSCSVYLESPCPSYDLETLRNSSGSSIRYLSLAVSLIVSSSDTFYALAAPHGGSAYSYFPPQSRPGLHVLCFCTFFSSFFKLLFSKARAVMWIISGEDCFLKAPTTAKNSLISSISLSYDQRMSPVFATRRSSIWISVFHQEF